MEKARAVDANMETEFANNGGYEQEKPRGAKTGVLSDVISGPATMACQHQMRAWTRAVPAGR